MFLQIIQLLIVFIQATVRYVRDDDNEYDVEYENGTVYTIKVCRKNPRYSYLNKTLGIK